MPGVGRKKCARSRTRTGTPSRAKDFKSFVSANFTIRASAAILPNTARRAEICIFAPLPPFPPPSSPPVAAMAADLGYTPEAMTSEKRILDNRRGTVGDFLRAALRDANTFRAVTAYFSVNGFDLLSAELRGVKDSRFLFGDPSSAAEVDKDGGKQKSFLMNEGKLALRDALRQKPLAQACAEWIRGGAKIRSVRHGFLHGKMYIADSDSKKGGGAVLGSSNFTRGGLSANLEINLAVNDEPARAEMPDSPFRGNDAVCVYNRHHQWRLI